MLSISVSLSVCPQAVSLSAELAPCWMESSHAITGSLQPGKYHLPPAGELQVASKHCVILPICLWTSSLLIGPAELVRTRRISRSTDGIDVKRRMRVMLISDTSEAKNSTSVCLSFRRMNGAFFSVFLSGWGENFTAAIRLAET